MDRSMVVDCHFHVGGTAVPFGAPPAFDFEQPAISGGLSSYLAPRMRNRITFRFAMQMMGLSASRSPAELDEQFESYALAHAAAPGVDRVVALAFDLYHRSDGAPAPAAQHTGEQATDLFVSNSYVFDLCRRHPGRFLFGASIHPYRANALEALEAVAQAGAVLIKWLPITQNIDAEDARTVRFLHRCAEIGMPVLAHYGGERTLTAMHPEFADPQPLFRTLGRLARDGSRPTVIVAHAAVGSNYPVRFAGYGRDVLDALTGPLADAPVFVDTSAATLPFRAHWLKRMAGHSRMRRKLLFGSDFPVPASPLPLLLGRGDEWQRFKESKSVVERNCIAQRAAGVDDACFQRTWEVLRTGLHARRQLIANR